MNFIERLNQYASYQLTVRALNALDKRQLADIGLNRADIRSMARQTVR